MAQSRQHLAVHSHVDNAGIAMISVGIHAHLFPMSTPLRCVPTRRTERISNDASPTPSSTAPQPTGTRLRKTPTSFLASPHFQHDNSIISCSLGPPSYSPNTDIALPTPATCPFALRYPSVSRQQPSPTADHRVIQPIAQTKRNPRHRRRLGYNISARSDTSDPLPRHALAIHALQMKTHDTPTPQGSRSRVFLAAIACAWRYPIASQE